LDLWLLFDHKSKIIDPGGRGQLLVRS
jgi:hypothetical protein